MEVTCYGFSHARSASDFLGAGHLGRLHLALEQIVAVCCLLNNRFQVLSQQVAFVHKFLGGLCHTAQIVLL